jgi:hypothetical protein
MRLPSLLATAVLLVAACTRSVAPPASPAPPAAEEGEDQEDADDDETPPATTAKPPAHRPHATASGPCKKDLAHCTPIGCAKAGSPHAIFNQLKRRTTDRAGNAITRETARTITLEDLHELQVAADAALPDSKDLSGAQREQLALLRVAGGTFGEGTGVRLVGFIAPDSGTASSGAHPGGIESVNCRLTKPEERDVHVPVVARPDQPECSGVVVEPIPQTRAEHPSWTSTGLRRIAHQKKLVMFVGALFWHNEHKVNPDCGHLKSGQPKRMSLWEIHPVAELYVCDAAACSADDKAGWRKVD